MGTSAIMLLPFKAAYKGLVFLANSPCSLIVTYLGLLVSSSVIYGLAEGKSIGDSLWWAVVTASTVGYGDTYPITAVGRILAGLLISTMVLLVIPLITAHFASKLIVDQDAFNHEEQEQIKDDLRAIRRMLEDKETLYFLEQVPVGRSPGFPDYGDDY